MPDIFFVGQMAYNAGTYISSALSTSRISIAINKSVDFTGRNWCATCGVCWEYTIIVDSFYMGKTNEANSIPICYCTASPNDDDLLEKINLIARVKGAGPFLTLATAMAWVRTEGIFITNQNYPTIPTLNHVLLLDAGLTASYPNQGVNWYNMATSSNNGTLNGGITWNSDLRGYLDFNGSSGYVSFASTSSIPVGNSNYTINVWFNPDTLGTDGLIGWGGYGTNNAVNAVRLTATGIENVWGGNDLSVTVAVSTGNWHNVVATFDGTTRSLYLDGALIGSDTPTSHNVTISSNLTVGKTDSSEYFDGKISLAQILPSALTAAEVLQGYNNFNTRYNDTFTEICVSPNFCNSPTPTPTSPSPTPTMTPPPTPPTLGQCADVTNNYGSLIFLDYMRRDGTQACQPIGVGETLPVCVYPGQVLNMESWDGFPCSSPNNILLPSAITVVGVPYECYNAGECIQESLNAITLAYDPSGYGGVKSLGCSLVSICAKAGD